MLEGNRRILYQILQDVFCLIALLNCKDIDIIEIAKYEYRRASHWDVYIHTQAAPVYVKF